MFIRRKERLQVYQYLFKEGVCVVKKDVTNVQHPEIPVRNLEVMALLKSLHSRGFVRETYNWNYYYYYLENEGIEFLRSFLNLPDEVVPDTLNRPQARAARAEGQGFSDEQAGGDFGGKPRGGFGRGRDDGYRRDGGDRGFGRGRRE